MTVSSISRRWFRLVVERCPIEPSCSCDVLELLPKNKQIDFNKNLNGTKAEPWKHVLVLSHGYKHPQNWPSKLELVPESLSNKIQGLKRQFTSPHHPVLVSQAILPFDKTDQEKVYIYPDNIEVTFPRERIEDFMNTYLIPDDVEMIEPTLLYFATQPSVSVPRKPKDRASFEEKEIKKDIVLVCGHAQRDVRCGLIAPLLVEKFKSCFEKRNLKDIDVGYISHVGGHAYAGNVIYFPRDLTRQSVWYGRVFPQHVDGIVENTILNDIVIKELYRGTIS